LQPEALNSLLSSIHFSLFKGTGVTTISDFWILMAVARCLLKLVSGSVFDNFE
jgi:hypothetical protein